MEGKTFNEVLEELALSVGVKIPSSHFNRENAPKKRETRQNLFQVNQWAQEFFQSVLHKWPVGKEGLAYLKKRGILPATISKFNLGMSPFQADALFIHLREKLAKRKNFQMD